MEVPRLVAATETQPRDDAQRSDQPQRGEPESSESRRAELLTLLIGKDVPEKDEILRVKALVRELSRDGTIAKPGSGDVKDFISAYLDLYMGRMTGEKAIEKSGLRRCLDHLGVPRRSAAQNHEGSHDGPPP